MQQPMGSEATMCTEFTSTEVKRPRRRSSLALQNVPQVSARFETPRRKPRARFRFESEESAGMGALLVKAGICAAACALVLSIKLIDTPLTSGITQGVKAAITEEYTLDETLGKLKFVQVPEIAAVFGQQQARLTAPVKGAQKGEFGQQGVEGTIFAASAGESVYSPGEGVVFAIGKDETLGEYVRVKHNSQFETFCYGLADISVEEGQPLSGGDLIGKVGKSGEIYFEVRLRGKPQDPAKYLTLTGGNEAL